MYLEWLPRLLAAWTILTLALVLVVDLIAAFSGDSRATVSYIIWSWGREYPFV